MKIDAIKAIAMRKMKSAMSATAEDLKPMLDDNVTSFYSGIPKIYERTGELTNAPKVSGVKGGGDSCSIEMKLDHGAMNHTTGSFNEGEIIDVTNLGTAGVVGSPGYWDRAKENAKLITNSHLSIHFTRRK